VTAKSFDVVAFLQRHSIRYVTDGANTRRGEVSINCPWCARTSSPDPSEHLGIRRDGSVYACWRDRRHSGRKIAKLVAVLIGCSIQRACEIVGTSPRSISEFDKVKQMLSDGGDTNSKQNGNAQAVSDEGQRIFNSFKPLTTPSGRWVKSAFARRYAHYLRLRGFRNDSTLSPGD